MAMATISTNNSTNIPLGADTTFTGTGEDVLEYSSIGINAISSHASATNGLKLQFSSDNTNWDIIYSYSIPATSGKVYVIPIIAKYFRLTYTNGTTPQTYFRLQTLYNITPLKDETIRLSDDITAQTHVTTTKSVVMDYMLEVSRGHLSGMSVIEKVGRNPQIGTTEEDMWEYGGIMTWSSAAAQASIVSTSAEDDADKVPAGTGAYTVRTYGLDSNYNEINEIVTLNGITPVSTANSYLRISKFYVATAGSTGSNQGDITISISGNVQSIIITNENNALAIHYTVPAGKTAYLILMTFSTGKDSDLRVGTWVRPYGEIFRLVRKVDIYESTYYNTINYVLKANEKTDTVIRAKTSAGTQAGSVSQLILLIDN